MQGCDLTVAIPTDHGHGEKRVKVLSLCSHTSQAKGQLPSLPDLSLLPLDKCTCYFNMAVVFIYQIGMTFMMKGGWRVYLVVLKCYVITKIILK